jgi:hypothetical protein
MGERESRHPSMLATDNVSWLGILAGPVAWIVDQGMSYVLASPACISGRMSWQYAISGISLALIAAGLRANWRDLRRHHDDDDRADDRGGRGRFVILVTTALTLLFGMVVVGDIMAKLVIAPCLR